MNETAEKQKELGKKRLIRLSRFGGIIEALTVSVLLVSWVYIYIIYNDVPDTIVTHYNFAGQADATGPKNALWSMAKISTGLYILLTVVQLLLFLTAHYNNDTGNSNSRNTSSFSATSLSILKLIMVCVFAFLIILPTSSLAYQENPLKIIFLALIPIVFVPTVYFLWHSTKRLP